MRLILFIVISLVLIFIYNIVHLKGESKSYRSYWDSQVAAPLQEGAITYVALGDSAAEGIGASKPGNGYVGLITSAINKQTGKPVRIINLSKTGAKIADVINTQMPALNKLDLPVDVVVTLDVGANDMKVYDKVQFDKQINELFSKLPKQTVVADVPYFGGGVFRAREKSVLSANIDLLAAAKNYDLKVAALHNITKDRNSWFIFAADLFHPNNKGYKNWFEAFWIILEPQISK